MQTLSLLDKQLNRLLAQRYAFSWVFAEIAGKPGLVFELGLGTGRTFSHLKQHLPGREIYVFDKDMTTAKREIPSPAEQVEGLIQETLPLMAEKFAGQVIIANSDVGARNKEHNRFMAGVVTQSLPKAIAPGGIILSDLDLDLPGFETIPLPAGAPQDAYYIYRKSGRA